MKPTVFAGAVMLLISFLFGVMLVLYPDSKIALYSEYKFTTECHGMKFIGEDKKRCIGILKYYYE